MYKIYRIFIQSPCSAPLACDAFKPIWLESSGRTASCFHSCRLWRWLWRQKRPRWVWPHCSGMGEKVCENRPWSQSAAPKPGDLRSCWKQSFCFWGTSLDRVPRPPPPRSVLKERREARPVRQSRKPPRPESPSRIAALQVPPYGFDV